MYRVIIMCLISLLFVSGAGAQRNQSMIDLVKTGKVKVARASWWGFDAADSTSAIQDAINSGVRKLVIDNVGSPWIVKSIMLVSNQTIVFEPGVEVIAKRGEFKGKGDCLFRANGKENITLIGYGAVLRMRRADYDGPGYEKAEWRHVLSICGCTNVKVYGLTLAESGGDGIYLGSGRNGEVNKNIIIRDVKCIRNYRQGISVINAENLLIEKTIMCGTAGTPPQAGIDFEPNLPSERLVNIVMRDCVARDNQGDGYEFYLSPLKAMSEPVSIRIENCTSIGNNHSVFLATGNSKEDAVKGTVEFVNCNFRGGRNGGLFIVNKPESGCKVRFMDCSILDPEGGPPILLKVEKSSKEPIGGIEFHKCLIRNLKNRAPVIYEDNYVKVPPKSVFGEIILDQGSERKSVEVRAEWIIGLQSNWR
ncbi:MAG: right-handed parallel beta-helix repeat-containing protein [Armatimonadota bacterium]|nr:right-handed parallel beta-helix repeat-containing protein [Armatimonadota bacterium]